MWPARERCEAAHNGRGVALCQPAQPEDGAVGSWKRGFMIMDAPKVLDIKAFVPAKDLALSIQFYSDLGFKTNWSSSDAAEMEIGSCRFVLERFYVKEHASNFM